MTDAERRLDCYRSWLFALCALACGGCNSAAVEMFRQRCAEHGVPL